MNVRKNLTLHSVLCIVFLWGCGVCVVPAFAEEAPENVQAEQTESDQADDQAAAETASKPENPSDESTKETSEEAKTEEKPQAEASDDAKTDDKPQTEAAEEAKSDDKPEAETSAKETESDAEAAQKPLVIDGLVLTDAERRVFELTNVERRKRGLPALRLDRRLMESARRQANWMARTGVFRHGNSGFAENIAMGQRSSRDVVIAWMNSSGHFRNMMNRGHGAIGVGSYRGRNGSLYWCQQFSR